MHPTCRDDVLAAEAVEVSDRGAGRSPPLMLLAQLGANSSAAAAAAASAPMGPGAAVSAVTGLQGYSRVSVASCAEAGGAAHLRCGQHDRQEAAGQLCCSCLACFACSSWCASHKESSQGRQWVMSGQLLTEVPCLNALATSLQPTSQQNGTAHDQQPCERPVSPDQDGGPLPGSHQRASPAGALRTGKPVGVPHEQR